MVDQALEVVGACGHLLWVWLYDLSRMGVDQIGVGMNNRIAKNALILILLQSSSLFVVGLQRKRIVLIAHDPECDFNIKRISLKNSEC